MDALLENILPQIAAADERTLYKILAFLGRKKRRKVLNTFQDIVNDRHKLLRGQSPAVCRQVKEKFTSILNHYNYRTDYSPDLT